MIHWDTHMHSSFSSDSDTAAEVMVNGAIARHLQGICFTEHLDPDFPENPDKFVFDLDQAAYSAEVRRLQALYHSSIEILHGIELGLQPHLKDTFAQTVKEHDFDFIIGSVHVLNDTDPYYGEVFYNKEDSAVYHEYFVSIMDNLRSFHDIDSLGHLDYIVRYGKTRNANYRLTDHIDIIDEILLFLIRHQIALEVNSGGYHYGLGVPNPMPEIIVRYKELGGKLLTIGADAHSPERIAENFDSVSSLLKSLGFQYYTVYKKRNPEFIPL